MQTINKAYALLLCTKKGRLAYVTGPAITRYYALGARAGLQMVPLKWGTAQQVWEMLWPQQDALQYTRLRKRKTDKGTYINVFTSAAAPWGINHLLQQAAKINNVPGADIINGSQPINKYTTAFINNANRVINTGHNTLQQAVNALCALLRAGVQDVCLQGAGPAPLVVINNGYLYSCALRPYLRTRLQAAASVAIRKSGNNL
mgnify:FL=1